MSGDRLGSVVYSWEAVTDLVKLSIHTNIFLNVVVIIRVIVTDGTPGLENGGWNKYV